MSDAFREPPEARLDELARSLYSSARFGDGIDIMRRLGDGEPWLTIRRAVFDVLAAVDATRTPPMSATTMRRSVVGIPRP